MNNCYLLRSVAGTWLICCVLILCFSCASVSKHHIGQNFQVRSVSSGITSDSSSWVLDSLLPDENTIFIRRRKVEVSIYVELSGPGDYLLQFTSNRRNYKPTPYALIVNEGQVDLKAQVSKFIKPKGKTELVTVSIYKVEMSETGRTVIYTLLKQVRREFDVYCRNWQGKGNY